LGRGIEVKTLESKSKTVQVIEMPDITFVAYDKALFVATKNACWILKAVPLDIQVRHLPRRLRWAGP
jgi:hypothetical protein